MIKNKVNKNENEKVFDAKEGSLLPVFDEKKICKKNIKLFTYYNILDTAKDITYSFLKGVIIGGPISAVLYVGIYYCKNNKVDNNIIICLSIIFNVIAISCVALWIYSKELNNEEAVARDRSLMGSLVKGSLLSVSDVGRSI
ncbi:hypothetical protein [Candidatus Neoehrlichia procyonis]|uniref:Uncharacterized protein n=1 Tax=Candidatus Neoehrlichia procyonis str. RAC413 TaxID=1359163 RepID=A0A0F3NM52_9RICK|nr:hypothetical protein [Candidatus Neoehrlichia lotoris]KJV68782.1 hypothetical protein NLO413_0146 [Candidatus Neoehrlichia lotoris str. RAC413]